jgi:metaxin
MAMSNDDPPAASQPRPNNTNLPPVARWHGSLFSIPPPLKRIFDKFPLVTYGPNELPLRAPRGREENVLHVFTSDEDAANGKPSFNPSCLKWQVSVTNSIGTKFRQTN